MTSDTPTPSETKKTAPKKRSGKSIELDSVIDMRRLRAQLKAAAEDNLTDAKQRRAVAMDLLHGALFRGRMIAQERLNDGEHGLAVARLQAEVMNQVLSALFEFASEFAFEEKPEKNDERLSVLAVGGYGRNVLAPSSDIDLLFIRNYKTTPYLEQLIEYMLYILWDMGLKVGHSVRTIDECIKMAKEDLNTQTAILDARFLFGDADLADTLISRYRSEVMKGHEAKFIADKLAERDKRHVKQGDTRYVVEPNIKEGKGGLRDLQTLFWLVRAQYGGVTLEDILSHRAVISSEEAMIFRQASRFLWSVRCHIHFLTGRPEERLSFDLQPEIASRMGFKDIGERMGVELFMKRYFQEAKAVGALTRIICAKLEADHQKTKPSLFSFLPLNFGLQINQPGFKMESGRLSVESSDLFRRKPIEMLRLFRLAEENRVDIHPHALSAVTRSLVFFREEEAKSEEARQLFLDLLINTRDPGPILRMMNEAGLLGQVVPEFGEIVAQTQFNMYHHFTVDEHTLRAVEYIAEMERGDGQEIFALPAQVFPEIENKRALYLAMLLHDTGKGMGDQQIEGAKTARAASLRLGVGEEEAELVSWLVRNHLEMSDCAQKRDLSDPRTISQFAARVGNMEKLSLLLILTVADIRAVGPYIWNGWKGQLLKELYNASSVVLKKNLQDETEIAGDLDKRGSLAKSELIARKGELPAILEQMEPAFWTGRPDDQLDWMIDTLRSDASETVIDCRVSKHTDSIELLVATKDRERLFSDLVAALIEENVSIISANIYTGAAGGVVDTFILQDEFGGIGAYGEKTRSDRLIKRVREAIANGMEPSYRTRRQKSGREAVFLVDPDVIFDNQGSKEYTILEVTGKERTGMLYELARLLADRHIRLHSAHAGAYGERVHDIFYVQNEQGKKLSRESETDGLASSLLDVLSGDGDDAPRTPARKLARARSAESF